VRFFSFWHRFGRQLFVGSIRQRADAEALLAKLQSSQPVFPVSSAMAFDVAATVDEGNDNDDDGPVSE
jgi:hypothetical protein